jgi:hypothetical protein
MARVAVQLTNFTGGELSPRLDGRNDLAKYASGCKTLQNMVVYPHGSAARRPGTNFVAEVKTSSAFTRLVPFEFSTTQTYILEFGNQYIRYYKDDGAVLESNLTITGITQANPGVLTGSFTTSSYPVVESTALYNSGGSAVTTAPVTMPANIVSGDLLIMVFKPSSAGVATTPTGFTLLTSRVSTANSYIYYKVSDGTEGSVVNVTLTSAHVSAITYRISNYTGAPEAAFAATNVNDPPSLTTSWSSTKNLFIAACTTRRSDNDFTVAPTGYSGLLTTGNTSSASTTHCRLATATKQVDGQTDNPAAFTTTGTLDEPQSATIVIKGVITDVTNGSTIVISGVVGMTQVNGKRFKIANKTATTFQLQDIDGTNVNTTSFSAYTSGGVFNVVYEIATSYLTADLETLKFAQSADVMYIAHPNYPVSKLSRTGHTSWTLEEIDFVNGPFLDHNITETKLTASAVIGDGITITASDITGINNDTGFQSTDVGRLIHLGNDLSVAKITSVTSTLVVVADVLETLATTTPTTLSENLDASATTVKVVTTKNFPSTGTLIIEDEQITYTGKSTSPMEFTGCTRGANSTIAVKHDDEEKVFNLAIEATDDFALGAFSETTGYPSCVTFFEQRLVFAGTTSQPQTLYFSKSGDYENMDDNYHGTIADDDAIIYTIASNQVNAIRFLSATRTLIVGTVGGEFSVSGGGTDDPVTPTNILIKKQSNNGCANIDAIPVGNVTLFLQRAKRKIRELAYNFDVDGYVAPDLTILAEHITESGINEMSYQQEPNQLIWCVRSDGRLVCLTYQREQQVVAWHQHIFGGAFGTGIAVCESIATIPTDDKEYQTWVVVKRTINGVTRRYVEYLNEFDFDEDDNTDFNFLDSQLEYAGATTTLNTTINTSATSIILTSATSFTTTGTVKIDNELITYTGISTNTLTGCVRATNSTTAASHTAGVTVSQVVNAVSGLDHLEGQTVSVLANGATHPNKTVASGAISLARFVNKVKVGLAYTSILQTMRLDAGSQNGTSQAKTKRIYNITVRLYESVGVEVGPDLDNMETIPFRSSATLMDQSIPVFTGDKEVEFRGNYETNGFIFVRQTQPLPLTVLSLYPELITNDG